ncbi:MAG: hypothetical protein A4E72_01405 [Syntrophus sp. PtaU1.Bin208]|nr:MAG: hypothetical protein A4E72_01405 [Syntrophus sp. PtaU1.Bin208]
MYLIFYTDRMPKYSSGCANGPIIRIRPAYRDDRGLLEHEKVHVKQWWRTFGFHSLLYLCSKKYRLAAEVEAYRVQLRYNPENILKYAGWLSADEPEGYGCQNICTREMAIELLRM